MRLAPVGQMPVTSSAELALERGAAVRPTGADGGIGGLGEATATGTSVFERAMTDAVNDAAMRAQVSEEKVQALAAGTADDLHGTLISTKEAEISLRLVNSVRNKLLDAFHELWRTNV